jgi:transcriptional regulator with XRE-family HTH domain
LLVTLEVDIQSDKASEMQRLIRRIVAESGITQQQLARDAGLSYAALHAWLIGTRAPSARSLLQLIDGLEARAEELRRVAASLRSELRKTL